MKFFRLQLGGIHADLGGEEVDHALDRLRRLGPPGTADRRHGSRVRDDREPFDLDARDRVDPAREQPGQVRQKGADTGVRTGVRKDVDPVGEQLAVAGPAELELEHAGRGRAGARSCSRSWSPSSGRACRGDEQARRSVLSSAPNALLAPKPPPTSGAIDAQLTWLHTQRRRERRSGRGAAPAWRATRSHGRPRRPGRPRSAPRAGTPAIRWLTIVSETTTSHPLKRF